MNNNDSDALGSTISTSVGMVGGFLASIYGYLSSTEAVLFIGLIATVGGFCTNFVFQKRKHKRETAAMEIENKLNKAKLDAIEEDLRMKKELHEVKMKEYKGERRVA